MHRVDSQKRKKLILRIVSYSVLVLLTVATSAVLLYVALGYRVDRDGEVIRSGLLLVDARPVAADIYINGQNKNDPTASKFVLPAGRYGITLKRQGYRDWSRTVNISASGVENLYYPQLIPQKLSYKKQLILSEPQALLQSPDKKLVFYYANNAVNPQVITLDEKQSVVQNLALPASFVRQSGGLGSFRALEWSLDNRHVLVEQKVGADKRILSIDTKNGLNSIDVTAAFGGRSFTDPHYAGKKADRLYGLNAGVLYQLDLSQKKATALLGQVKSYQTFSDDTLSFARYNTKQRRMEAGLWRDGVTTIVHSVAAAPSQGGITRYVSFDTVDYFVVQLANEKTVTVYQNPLSEPILAQQIPLIAIRFQNSLPFTVSANGQFVLMQHGRSVAVYDLDRRSVARFVLAKNESTPLWLDSHRFTTILDGVTYVSDFDNTNRFSLAKSEYGSVLFSNDYRSTYRFDKAENSTQLGASSMVAQ